MSINHQIDNDRVLRDSSGNTIGKVDFDGEVRDGYHLRGHVDNDGRYIDEYGRDHGWAVQRGNSSGSASSGAGVVVGLLAVGSEMGLSLLEPVAVNNVQCPSCGGSNVTDHDKPFSWRDWFIHYLLAMFTLGLYLIPFIMKSRQEGKYKRPKDGSHRYTCVSCGHKWQQMPPAKK